MGILLLGNARDHHLLKYARRYRYMIGKWNRNTLAIYVSAPHINPYQEIPRGQNGKVEDRGLSKHWGPSIYAAASLDLPVTTVINRFSHEWRLLWWRARYE